MQFLLECIGFGPDHDLDDLQRRLRREGLAVRGRSGEGDHQRLLLSHGLEVWLDPGRPAAADAPAIEPVLWPGVAPGQPSGFRVHALEAPHGAPFSSVVRASLAQPRSSAGKSSAGKSPAGQGGLGCGAIEQGAVDDAAAAQSARALSTLERSAVEHSAVEQSAFEHSAVENGALEHGASELGASELNDEINACTRRLDGGPVIGWSFALVDDGPPPQTGEVIELALTGFALDVTAVLPAPPGGRARLDGARGWVTPQFSGPELPGCVELALPIEAVQVLHNPLSGEPVERVVTTTSEGVRLELFTSRWQRDEDGLAPLEPGGWIAGTFLAVGRRAEGYPYPRRAVSRRQPARL